MVYNKSFIIQTLGKIVFVFTPVTVSIVLGILIGERIVRSPAFATNHLSLLPFFAFVLMSFATFGTSFFRGLISLSLPESMEQFLSNSSRMPEKITTRSELKQARQEAMFKAELRMREQELFMRDDIERHSIDIRTQGVIRELDLEKKISQERHKIKIQELEQRLHLLDLESEILKRETLVAKQREELQRLETGPGGEVDKT